MGNSGQRNQPRSKRSRAQKQNTSKLTVEKYVHRSNKENKKPKGTVRQQLAATQNILNRTVEDLSTTQSELETTKKALSLTSKQLNSTRSLLAASQSRNSDLYRALRTVRRKSQRYFNSKMKLATKVNELCTSLSAEREATAVALQQRDRARADELWAIAAYKELLNSSTFEIAKHKQLLQDCRAKNRALQMKNLRSQRSRDKAQRKARQAAQSAKSKKIWKLRKGGSYTADARAMARTLVKAGCSQEKVGSVIRYVAKKAGLEVKEEMSRRTVQRSLIEGGVAARIQLAHEMAQADGVTLSSDATTVRGENYEGAFVMINKGPQHKMRILSMTSTVSHSSETQLVNLKKQITAVSVLYRKSPLGRRSALNFEVHDFTRVWRGGNGDHAPDVKLFHRLGKGWKHESSRILFGYEEIKKMDAPKIVEVVCEIMKANLEEVGGSEEWEKLSDAEKDTLSKSSMDTLVFRLGEEAFLALPPEVKQEIELFFWAGCSMHKELNCCKAFEDGMQAYYEALPEEDRPVLLANRDNDATIQLADASGDSTAAVQRALKNSERGAIKLISLFGALVNHKDDKKGLHDVYENYFRAAIGAGVRFPDTSNTRYQSHGRGGARVISYFNMHLAFMEFVKDHKVKRGLNHMESNILKGMNCKKTMAMMVVFVLFCMAVMHPYAGLVRGPGTEELNILDLGPLHDSVKRHIQKLIDNPSLLFSTFSDSYKDATLDGRPWSDMKAWAECVRLAPTLPDIVPLALAGLKSSLARFEKFTTEFEAGGLIDLSTAAERLAAHMPSTNDANEGLLGMWRRFSRESPSSTVAHFTDQAMFNRNETQAFIDLEMNTEEDYAFLLVDDKRAKDAVKDDKAKKETERLAAIGVVVDREVISQMTDQDLRDQLEQHRRGGDKEIPKKSHLKNKAERLTALLGALGRAESGVSVQSA
ncbi:hypothetical protein C8R47DRAFT_1215669 [Mycena vitilis]|nr:hypothetical protein C8R47DRAFT_1215669 [Mycena vitilis]